jgi:hypothetical protein
MNLIDLLSPVERAGFALFSRSVTYEAQTVKAFSRGLRADDLFASAQQLDSVLIMDATIFAAAHPTRPKPKRMDKVTIGTIMYSVQEWRGAPNDATPVFFKCLIRGGTQ